MKLGSYGKHVAASVGVFMALMSTAASKLISTCPDSPEKDEKCVSVSSWGELKRAIVDRNEERTVLCPFRIEKKARLDRPIVIRNSKEIACQRANDCLIMGGGTHIVLGNGAPTILNGLTFMEATTSAVRVMSRGRRTRDTEHKICSCHFIRNVNKNQKGGAIKVSSRDVIPLKIEYSEFVDNLARSGGAIYTNSETAISDTEFLRNRGKATGGVIVVTHTATLEMQRCEFAHNSAFRGPVIYLKAHGLFHDHGANTLGADNGDCNGYYDTRTRTCLPFGPHNLKSAKKWEKVKKGCPALPPIPRRQRMPRGYYNFNPDDRLYGPSNWHNVDISENSYRIYRGVDARRNHCNREGQSPIDVGGRSTENCYEHHQIRTKAGQYSMNHRGITFSITPTRLRLDFARWMNSESLPTADLPGGFGPLAISHLELSFPSQHTINGKLFDGEYTLVHVQNGKGRIVLVSVLIEVGDDKQHNEELQILLDQWEGVRRCGLERNDRRLRRQLDAESELFSSGNDTLTVDSMDEDDSAAMDRDLQRTSEWNIYGPKLMPSIHFFAYEGTLLEPPCSPNAHWRIMDQPMFISPAQMQKMKNLLGRKSPCYNQPEGQGLADVPEDKACFRRPIQPFGEKRKYWKCSRTDFVSDCVRRGKYCD